MDKLTPPPLTHEGDESGKKEANGVAPSVKNTKQDISGRARLQAWGVDMLKHSHEFSCPILADKLGSKLTINRLHVVISFEEPTQGGWEVLVLDLSSKG